MSTGPVTQIGPTSAILTGVVDPHGEQTSFFFQYGLTATYGFQTFAGTVPAGTVPATVSQQLQGISPLTVFHYRLVAPAQWCLGGTAGRGYELPDVPRDPAEASRSGPHDAPPTSLVPVRVQHLRDDRRSGEYPGGARLRSVGGRAVHLRAARVVLHRNAGPAKLHVRRPDDDQSPPGPREQAPKGHAEGRGHGRGQRLPGAGELQHRDGRPRRIGPPTGTSRG